MKKGFERAFAVYSFRKPSVRGCTVEDIVEEDSNKKKRALYERALKKSSKAVDRVSVILYAS